MECTLPFYDYISNCQDEIVVNAHLTPATTYQWLIEDKFGKLYNGTALTDGSGNFTIDVTDLPPGLLNSFGGTFILQVKALYTAATINLTMKQNYDAIFFTIKGGSEVKTNLGLS